MGKVNFASFGKNEPLARQLLSDNKLTKWNIKEGASLDKLRKVAERLLSNDLTIEEKINVYKSLDQAIKDKTFYYQNSAFGKFASILYKIPLLSKLYKSPVDRALELKNNILAKNMDLAKAAKFSPVELACYEGAQYLAKNGVEGRCNLQTYNYLLTKLFLPLKLNLIYYLPNSGKSDYIFYPGAGVHADKLVMQPATGETFEDVKRSGKFLGDYFQQIQNERIKEGLPFLKKVFMPFIVPGSIGHAILLVIEVDENQPREAKVTVIDPLGKDHGYKRVEAQLIYGLVESFNLKTTSLLFNQKRQQFDGISCGFHQVLNIKELLEVPDVQSFVQNGQLKARQTNEIKKWIKELHPEAVNLS